MYLLAFVLHFQLAAGGHHPQDLGCLEKLNENRGCGPENPSFLGCFFMFFPRFRTKKNKKTLSERRFFPRALCIRLVFLGWILEWNSKLKPGTTCLPKKALGIEATNLHPKKVAKKHQARFVVSCIRPFVGITRMFRWKLRSVVRIKVFLFSY